MMTKNPTSYMPLWVGDYLADTQHLSTTEHGIYLLLLMHYWRNGALTTDKKKLMRICGVSRYTSCKSILDDFFYTKDGHWHNKRIDQEIQKSVEITEKRTNAGKAGANARWDSKRIRLVSDSQKQTHATHNHDNKYIYYGEVFRVTDQSITELMKSYNYTNKDILITEIQKADEYYSAQVADGKIQESEKYSATMWFKLKSWLERNSKKENFGTKKPNIKSAI